MGRDAVFRVRENFSDFTFINTFVDQDFVDRNELFVVGKRLNEAKGVWEYFVESRDAGRYRQMLIDSLYHPPCIEVDQTKTDEKCLYLVHAFEGKPLVPEFIGNTMLGISYLWGGTVELETTELVEKPAESHPADPQDPDILFGSEPEPKLRKVLYTMENRKLARTVL
jgi:stage V sporulation protein R